MKKIYKLILIILLVLPTVLKADESEYLNFKETLAAESMEEKFNNYEENDNQIVIYLFRGQGCQFCRSFLTFMNDITQEYGKYFKMVTFEVWYNEANNKLLNDVSSFLEEEAGGVPYIIIGNKVFPGYNSRYDNDIKKAILDLYNTPVEDRYDVFDEIDKYKTRQEKITTIIDELIKEYDKNGKLFKSDEPVKEEKNNGITSKTLIVWLAINDAIIAIIFTVVCFLKNKRKLKA